MVPACVGIRLSASCASQAVARAVPQPVSQWCTLLVYGDTEEAWMSRQGIVPLSQRCLIYITALVQSNVFVGSLFTEEGRLVLFVIADRTSSVISFRRAPAPVISLVHVVISSSVRFEIVHHPCPCAILRVE